MNDLTRLVAVSAIPHAQGTIAAGQAFDANLHDASCYVLMGKAITHDEYVARGWQGLQWRGCEVVIMASGPSLTVEQCEAAHRWRDAVDNRRAIVINTTFRRAPWADVLYACDKPWWDVYFVEVTLKDWFQGKLWTQDQEAARKYNGYIVGLPVNHIQSRRGQGLCRDIGVIYQGENSGYQAIGLAHQAGVARILLLGYDMHENGGLSHWHGEHPGTLKRRNTYESWIPNFHKLAVDLHNIGVSVINCSPDTALTSFPRADWQEVLA